MTIDLVIPYVLPPHGDHELRFALRSACKAVDVGRVYLLGDCPEWCVGVDVHTGGDYTRDRQWNVMRKLWDWATAWRDEAQEFALWNDDMYLLEPSDLPYISPGTIGELWPKLDGRFREAAETTARVLGDDAPSFEAHCPIRLRVRELVEALTSDKTVCFRTIAANEMRATPVREPDRLAHTPDDVAELLRGPWFASTDTMANDPAFTRPMLQRFPEKCRFER